MKIIYFGPMLAGSTSLQRARTLAAIPGVELIELDSMNGVAIPAANVYQRVCWRLGWPVDQHHENRRLLDIVRSEKPDAVIVDNSKVLAPETVRDVKAQGAAAIYYSPDDMTSPQFLKRPLKRSLPDWDLIFTTKTYNVSELQALGARLPVLTGNAFDPSVHRPLNAAEVGEEFEKFDLVFVGAFERDRFASLSHLAEEGSSVLVHGARARLDGREWTAVHKNLVIRAPAFGAAYAVAMHKGKIALGFLRKMNRDRITTRSIEIPAMARPMLAEKTDEHDAHFVDGVEYVGFTDDADLVAKAKLLLSDEPRRQALSHAGRRRCLTSGYSTLDRAREMLTRIETCVAADRGGT